MQQGAFILLMPCAVRKVSKIYRYEKRKEKQAVFDET